MARYKSNFITEAIIRIEFAKPITSLTNTFPEELDKLILPNFPNKESKSAFAEQLHIAPNSEVIERKRNEFKEWNFYGNERKKRVCITRDFFFNSSFQYISYDDFTASFFDILKYFSKNYDEFSARRIGIRYINNIQLDNENPLDWTDYINENMLDIFKVKPADQELTRAFQILELAKGDIKTKFQYGMHNPDFPSTIKKKIFVMDIDNYKNGNMNGEELELLVPEMHGIIENIFENSIKEKLRNLLNE